MSFVMAGQALLVFAIAGLLLPAGTSLILPQARKNIADGYARSGQVLFFCFRASVVVGIVLFALGVLSAVTILFGVQVGTLLGYMMLGVASFFAGAWLWDLGKKFLK